MCACVRACVRKSDSKIQIACCGWNGRCCEPCQTQTPLATLLLVVMRYDQLKFQIINEQQGERKNDAQDIDEIFGPMCFRHGGRGRAQKGSRFMDNGALISVRDERLRGAQRDLKTLYKAIDDNPKLVNRLDYFHRGVFPPPHEIEPCLNHSRSESLVERKRHHHFENGVIKTVRCSRRNKEKPHVKQMDYWNNGVVPPPVDMSNMYLNHSQEQNIADRNRGRTFGPNGTIMTYRRQTGRSQKGVDTGRPDGRIDSLRNGRSSVALKELQDQKSRLEAELLQLKLEKELETVNRQIALSFRT